MEGNQNNEDDLNQDQLNEENLNEEFLEEDLNDEDLQEELKLIHQNFNINQTSASKVKFSELAQQLASEDPVICMVAIEILANELTTADETFTEQIMETFIPLILKNLQNAQIPDISCFSTNKIIQLFLFIT